MLKILLIWVIISFVACFVIWPTLLGPRQDDD
jgi:hypothetical protein